MVTWAWLRMKNSNHEWYLSISVCSCVCIIVLWPCTTRLNCNAFVIVKLSYWCVVWRVYWEGFISVQAVYQLSSSVALKHDLLFLPCLLRFGHFSVLSDTLESRQSSHLKFLRTHLQLGGEMDFSVCVTLYCLLCAGVHVETLWPSFVRADLAPQDFPGEAGGWLK